MEEGWGTTTWLDVGWKCSCCYHYWYPGLWARDSGHLSQPMPFHSRSLITSSHWLFAVSTAKCISSAQVLLDLEMRGFPNCPLHTKKFTVICSLSQTQSHE